MAFVVSGMNKIEGHYYKGKRSGHFIEFCDEAKDYLLKVYENDKLVRRN